MLDNRKRTKIKNNKIQYWRLELASYSYNILYRPGKENAAADSLTRGFCSSTSISSLAEIHASLCHPGVTRLFHFVRTKNLPFSTGDVRKVCSSYRICAELKPSFYKREESHLIKASKPFERISIDFKGPLPSLSRNKYLLVIIDEYSRFLFNFFIIKATGAGLFLHELHLKKHCSRLKAGSLQSCLKIVTLHS